MQIDDKGKLGWQSRYVFHIFWFLYFSGSSFVDGPKSKNDLFLVVLASMDATVHLKWNQGCSSCATATRSSLPSVSKHWIWWLVQKQPELTNTRTKLVWNFFEVPNIRTSWYVQKSLPDQHWLVLPCFMMLFIVYIFWLLFWLENLQAFPPSVLCFGHVFSSYLTKLHQVNIRAQERRFYKSHPRTWIFQCWAVIMHLVLEPSVPVSEDWTETRSDFWNWNLYLWRTRLATRFPVPFMCGTKLEQEQRFCRIKMRGSFIKVKNRPTL